MTKKQYEKLIQDNKRLRKQVKDLKEYIRWLNNEISQVKCSIRRIDTDIFRITRPGDFY